MLLKSTVPHLSIPQIVYRGASEKDTMDHYFDDMFDLEKKIQNVVGTNVPMVLTEEDEQKIRDSHECHICKKAFENGEETYRDHDHFTGKFRGMAHKAATSITI